MSNFAVSGREGRQALKRRRENPISMLVLTKHSSILKNMFLSKKSFFGTASQPKKKVRRKIKYTSVKSKKEQETPDKTKLQLHALHSGLNLFKIINGINSYFNGLRNY